MIPQGRTRNVAAVFGGSGFIGRYVVKRLVDHGYVVRVAVRDPEAAMFLKPMGAVGQVVPLYCSVTNDATVRRAAEQADIVVNLVGILAESRPGDFDRMHAEGAGRIARIATECGVARFAHLSAIGADPASPSHYGASKARGEQAVRDGFPGATILRPSLVFGPEDQFFNRFAALARISPFMPVIAGDTRMQPVYVGDVADAVMVALHRSDTPGAPYELGGPQVWTFREILAYILKEIQRRRPLVDIPMNLARLQAGFLERVPGKLLTRDQLLMLAQDNVVSAGMPGLPDLGINPTPVDLVVPGYLRRFRPHGGRRGIMFDSHKGSDAGLTS
jgi:uncharacterized protein YbjT (DUF2867 family)